MTLSWHGLLYLIKIVKYCLDGVCALSWYTGPIRKYWSLPFLADWVKIASISICTFSVGSLSGYCLIAVRSFLGKSGHCRDKVVFYHAEDTNRIKLLLRTGESGRNRLETVKSGRFLNTIVVLLSCLSYKLVIIFLTPKHKILFLLITHFNQEWSYQEQKVRLYW